MTIQTVNVQNFERAYATQVQLAKVQRIADLNLKGTLYDLKEIRIFNMDGKRKLFGAGNRDSFNVFFNATPNTGSGDTTRDITEFPTMFGIEVAHGTRLKDYVAEGIKPLLTPEGEKLGVYLPEKHEIYIYHDLQQYPEAKMLLLMTEVFKYIKESVLDKKGQENSWVHSDNKEILLKKFKERIERQNVQQLAGDKERLAQNTRSVQEYQRSLKTTYDQIARLMKSISAVESGQSDVQEKLVKEMDNISSHHRVTDLRIEGDFIIVSIPNIIATDRDDRQFYIGNFQVKINIHNSDVKFFGDNPRRGYWGQDPHPHVSGHDGNACLGNVSATIAELCSQNEIYALVMTCIDFLESVNIDDSAGSRVDAWDRVDAKGEVIEEGSDHDDDEDREDYDHDDDEDGDY